MRGASRPKRRKAIKGSVFSHGPGLSIAITMRNTPKPLPMHLLHETFAIDPSSPTGLRWKHRPEHHFQSNRRYRQANSRNAGNPAGNANCRGRYGIRYFVHVAGSQYAVARIIWAIANGADPGENEIDHINGICSDNRLENLRLVTHAQNMLNRTTGRRTATGVAGVRWSNLHGKYIASISHNNKFTHLGVFTSLEDAIAARKLAEIQFHGEYSLAASRN